MPRPNLTMDAGFLRSVAPDAPTISHLLAGSDLVAALVQDLCDWTDDAALLEEAASLLRFKQVEGLSRVNGRPSLDQVLDHDRPNILVVDRLADDFVRNDVSPAIYRAMLHQARADHPAARIVVQRDRETISAFGADDLEAADVLLDRQVDPAELIAAVDAVYVVDSLLGLEGILAGKPVHVFGAPFYAGWGLTTDHAPPPPRPGPRTREALFAVCYLTAPTYTDPLSGEPCAPRVAFERMAAFRRHARRVAGHWVALNIPPPKQGVLRSFLEGPMSDYSPRPWRAPRGLAEPRYAAWTSRPNRWVKAALKDSPERVTHIEDGFLRSVGLGSGFQPSASLVFDSQGAYYDPSGRSDLIDILGQTQFEPELLEKAAALRRRIVELGLSKYNLGAGDAPPVSPPTGARVLLVTGQVENDQSLLTGGGGMTNLSLLERVRADNPEAYVIYKEHPDVTAGHRPGRISGREARRLANEVVGPANITRLIEAADEVHTITSLSGFEALLREKTVVTYGRPFYAGWGLTVDHAAMTRVRSLSLDALVAGALMLYPLYLDPLTRLPCDAPTFVARLAMLRDIAPTPIPAAPFGGPSRIIEAIRHSLWPAPSRAY